MQGYQFRLVLGDIYAASQAMDEMPTKEIRLSIHEASGSMGFGGEAQASADGPHYDFYGPVHLRAGVTGTVVYSTEEGNTGNVWIDGKAIFSKIITYTATSAISTTIPYDFSGMQTVWVDASSSFFIANDNTKTVNHVGYVASDGARIFMAQLRPERGQVLLVTNNPGTVYVRLLYTKTDTEMSSQATIAQLPTDTASVVQALSNRVGALERQAVDGIG